jgi:hypothetical protein
LKPTTIIESGIQRGLGTWMLRQASPTARLILLDPGGNRLVYRDAHPDTLYFTLDKFVDFSNINWTALAINVKETLIFFDDHQAEVKRTFQAWKAG